MHGLGPRRTKRIADAWEEQKAIKEVMVFLSGVGVSTSLAVRIYKRYADASIEVVRSEPYRLASEVWGIGFRTADTIAQAVGIPQTARNGSKPDCSTPSPKPRRMASYLPEPELVRDAEKNLQLDRELIDPCLEELVAEEGVIRNRYPPVGRPWQRSIWCRFTAPSAPSRPGCWSCCAPATSGCRTSPRSTGRRRWAGCSDEPDRTSHPASSEAVTLALTSKVALLTGGPGCGKSFTIRSVVELATRRKPPSCWSRPPAAPPSDWPS